MTGKEVRISETGCIAFHVLLVERCRELNRNRLTRQEANGVFFSHASQVGPISPRCSMNDVYHSMVEWGLIEYSPPSAADEKGAVVVLKMGS